MIILRKAFSKSDPEESITIGQIGNKVKYKDLTEKQLRNIAAYEDYKERKSSTKSGRKDDKKRDIMGSVSFGGLGTMGGGLVGSKIAKKYPAAGALIGAGTGALAGVGTWKLLKMAADNLHKNQALLAQEELERRGITDYSSAKRTGELNKEAKRGLKKSHK